MEHGRPGAAREPLEIARRLRQPPESNDLMKLACCASLRSQPGEALDYVERALAEGFSGDIEPDDLQLLAALHDDPRFIALQECMREANDR